MTGALTALAAAALLFWLLLVADRARRWPAEMRLDPASGDGARPGAGDIVVCVPARDEADMAPECLPALASQAEDLAFLVYVDDRSTDGTGEVARGILDASPAAAKSVVVEGTPPPPGWSGKLWALQRAIGVAGERPEARGARWWLFTDADILHPPGSLAALRRRAGSGERDLVSIMVRLRARTGWERLLIPPFVYFFHLLYPFRRVARPDSRVAAAAGGCVLVSRDALARAGGLEAVRGEVIDDVALARAVKGAGGRLWLGLCDDMVSRRPYGGLSGIADMVARTAFTQLRRSWILLAACTVWILALLVSPPVVAVAAAVVPAPWALAAALGAWTIQAASLLPAVRHHRAGGLWAWTLPAASALYLAMTLLSAWRHLRHGGPRWKGRSVGEVVPARTEPVDAAPPPER